MMSGSKPPGSLYRDLIDQPPDVLKAATGGIVQQLAFVLVGRSQVRIMKRIETAAFIPQMRLRWPALTNHIDHARRGDAPPPFMIIQDHACHSSPSSSVLSHGGLVSAFSSSSCFQVTPTPPVLSTRRSDCGDNFNFVANAIMILDARSQSATLPLRPSRCVLVIA